MTHCKGQFRSRANPSAGVIPYLQSTVCNVKNRCYGPGAYEDIPSYNGSLLAPAVKYGGPILKDDEVTAAAESIGVVVDVVDGLAASFNTTFWRKILSQLNVNACEHIWRLQFPYFRKSIAS